MTYIKRKKARIKIIMKAKDYKVLLELVRKYGISTILRFIADAWGDVWHEKYEIKSKETKMIDPQKEREGMSEISEADDIEDLVPVTPTENMRHWIPVREITGKRWLVYCYYGRRDC